MANSRVAVIGGGLSGLATAAKIHLADPTLELVLFEAADRVGGVVFTEHDRGFVIDHGADMFATNPNSVIPLCEQLGFADRLILPETTNQGARVVFRGALQRIPDGFIVMRATKLLPMLSTPILSVSGKLRFFAERWIKSKPESADESIGQFVRRRMGQEVLDRLVAPLAAGIYTGDIEKLSLLASMRPIAEMEMQYGSLSKARVARRRSGEDSAERLSTGARYSQFRSFKGGMYDLITGLADSLPRRSIRLESPTHSLLQCEAGWELTSNGKTESFDHVVVATPARVSARLLNDTLPGAAEDLRAIESASTAIALLGVRREDIERDISTFGFVVPATENRKILAGSFANHKFGGRAPQGHVLIRAFMGGALQSDLLDKSDDELIQIARDDLAGLIGLKGSPVLTRLIRWNEAMPQYYVGHLDRVERIQSEIDSTAGLSLISNAMRGVGVAAIVQVADGVAKKVVASFKS